MLRENELLAMIAGRNAGLPASVVIPPGDDMAAVRLGEGELLIAVDPVIEGVHFDREDATLEQIGRKAITRNLSDVAAMAARPVAAVVSAVLPGGLTQAEAARLFDAVRETGECFGCPVVGGDVAVVSEGALSLTVTVLAEPGGVAPVRRGTGQAGDGIYVSGVLGHSLAGHHLDFEPRVELARALAGCAETRPTAMMDLSDGLAQDLPRLCGDAVVELARLPVRAGTPEPGWKHALGDGEDYELLLTVGRGVSLPAEVEGVRLTRIGEVRDAGGVVFVDEAGQAVDTAGLGWEHGG